jgi:predicted DsbA family dithiol-disulfide isomerase
VRWRRDDGCAGLTEESPVSTPVEVFIDPSCPWAFITSRWLKEVAPQRDLEVTWRSFCLEIRDDYGVAPTIPEERREAVIAAHALSHRMLRIFEAARAREGETPVDALLTEWGRRFFPRGAERTEAILSACVEVCGLDADLLAAADEEKWDQPIVEAMDIAYEFGGYKTQTPTIVVRTDPPHGFKGPVMAPAPTGEDAVRFWDAIVVLSTTPGFFEITRPRRNTPIPPLD